MNAQQIALGCLVGIAIALQLYLPKCEAAVHTVNIDFGNSGVFSGDRGVLSSPGGTFWNEARIEGSRVPSLFDLRDEFGNPIVTDAPDAGGFPSMVIANIEVAPVTGRGIGPLNDGVALFGYFSFVQGIVISELAEGKPIDLVVYFADPVDDNRLSEIVVSAGNSGPQTVTRRFVSGNGYFPGAGPSIPPQFEPPLTDYVRFTDLFPGSTTLNSRYPKYGIHIHPPLTQEFPDPVNAVAHIAAIQIRGDFEFVPEPTTGCLAALALSLVGLFRGQWKL